MKLLKLVAIEQVEVGDTLIVAAQRYGVTSIEDETHGRELRLVDADGNRKIHLEAHGEKVVIEL